MSEQMIKQILSEIQQLPEGVKQHPETAGMLKILKEMLEKKQS